ncbi:MAG: carbohydrate binding family 9 domain-containing protein [Gammaproteobacteria bacterium]|nr:carbohydrate binding family 9 domain-containing protein [Gammaproteobacteria bacterium]
MKRHSNKIKELISIMLSVPAGTVLRKVLLALTLLFSSITIAQESVNQIISSSEEKSREIPHLEAEVEIDGVMDEDVWDRATLINDFHQYQPVEYADPSQRTDVRIFYTEDALYIAARLWDELPDQIAASILRQGQAVGADDVFTVILDPYLDRRNGYRFEVNSNGVRAEGLYQNVTGVESSWNGIWQASASRDEQGWIAEMRIPFQTISFSTDSSAWGINFNRTIKRETESIAWVSRNRQVNPGVAGTITGLSDLRQGRGLDIVPSIVTRAIRRFGAANESDSAFEPQVDLYYKVTSQLNASLTINTDFSATEVDSRQVNLTRFGLFFPEKRDFFIRDSDIFQFGQLGAAAVAGASGNASIPASAAQNARPFFSRRLGLGLSGEPVDINAGAKVSGRIGDWNLGSLLINQDEDIASGVAADTIFVGRASLNVLAESQVGVIATNGDPQSNLDNNLIGADFNYRNTRLANGKTVEASAFYQQSDTEGKSGDDASYGVVINYPSNQGWKGSYRYKKVEKNFDPAVGFVNQTGIEDYSVDTKYTHFFAPGGFLRTVAGYIDLYKSLSLEDGDYITDVKTVRWAILDNKGDFLFGRFIDNKENLRKDFTIFRASDSDRTIVIPAGSYSFYETMIGVILGNQRVLSGRLDRRWGEYFDGERDRVLVNASWRPNRNLQLTAQYTENKIELPQGNFTTRLFSINTQITFSATLSWANLIQYDNVSENLGINSRLHWIPKAGQQAFLVLNYGFEDLDKDNVFESTIADLSLKFNYTFRF